MKKSRKVIVKNDKGETIRIYKSTYDAGKKEGVSHETIRRTIMGENTKLQGNGKYYFWGDTPKKRGKASHSNKVILIKDNGDLEVFESQSQLARKLGVTLALVNHYVHGRCKSKGYKVYDYNYYVSMWGDPEERKSLQAEKEYSEEIKEEIVKKTETMYYVNVLVGLANETLVDGAVYKIQGSNLVYSRKNHALMIADKVVYSRGRMLEEVKVEYPLLTEKETDFLKNLLRAFSGVKGIRKCNGIHVGTEFIRIETNNPVDNVDLPTFKENQYYQSLKQNRLYSLDELGL